MWFRKFIVRLQSRAETARNRREIAISPDMQKYQRFVMCVALVVAFDKRFVAKNITTEIAISVLL